VEIVRIARVAWLPTDSLASLPVAHD